MATLRNNVLLFLEMSLDLDVTPSYSQLKKRLRSKHNGSLNVALHWLRQRGYISVQGEKGLYVYSITPLGLRYLHQIQNKNDVSKLTAILQTIGRVS